MNQPTAISEDRNEALNIAIENVGQRYVTPERSAEDLAKALCVTGSPKECIKAIEDRVDAGVRDFNMGFLADDSSKMFEQMELFSRTVIPHFQS